MVHTSPLDQAGTGDAGGMNVYVVETAKKMAQAGVSVDIFTRANKPNLPETIEIADGKLTNKLSISECLKILYPRNNSSPPSPVNATLLCFDTAFDMV